MKRCKFLPLMFALLLLLQSSVLAANTDTTVTVTLPTFAVTLNDTKIDSAHSEYPLIVYRDITYFPMTYHASRFLHLKSNWYQTEPKGYAVRRLQRRKRGHVDRHARGWQECFDRQGNRH